MVSTAAVVFGTRPELIKLAPVIHELRRQGVRPRCVWLQQHRLDVMEPILEFFEVKPDASPQLIRGNCTGDVRLGDAITSLNFNLEHSDTIVVQGDTLTAFAASIVAFYNKKTLIHVEAGLRTKSTLEPWPEEMHRRCISTMATWHCCPTAADYEQLTRGEGYGNAVWTGNTVVDAIHIAKSPANCIKYADKVDPWFLHHPVILVTAHRTENQGDGIREIRNGLIKALDANPSYRAIWVLHPNPATWPGVHHPSIREVHAMPYQVFIQSLMRARAVLSDSGGIQEEAATLGIPLIVTRKQTERPAALVDGMSQLVGTKSYDIKAALQRFMCGEWQAAGTPPNPFGGPNGTPTLDIVKLVRGV